MHTLSHQAEALHEQVVDLIKKYQFRDRNATCCHGISVSQCYMLETLQRRGSVTMQELAGEMHLAPSTVTRVVGQLIKAGYARRRKGTDDRRQVLIEVTETGHQLASQLWANVLASEKEILSRFPEKDRDTLIRFLEQLNQAVDSWKAQCCTPQADAAITKLQTEPLN